MELQLIQWQSVLHGHTIDFEIEMAIHPTSYGKIIINYPGADGSLDGYNHKYKTLAEYIVAQKLASVVRIPNKHTFGLGWDLCLRKAVDYVIAHSLEICGVKKPEIFLMGFSAGAGGIAMIAWEYPEVSKILLLEPTLKVGQRLVLDGIRQYCGELCIVVGSGEEALGIEVGNMIMEAAVCASKKELFEIPHCNHQFMGEANGRIVSQAPLYAFSDHKDLRFPDPTGGIQLYD